MKKKITTLSLFIATFCFIFNSNAQMFDGHAFMIGNYVEVGISTNGHIGVHADDFDGAHTREGGWAMPGIGLLSNPAMDGWDQYNGDYIMAGTPESGFGLTYTLLGFEYNKGNNIAGGLNQIPGSITDYYETADSIIVTWEGLSWITPLESGMEMTIVYELKKDQHYFTTSIDIENVGVESLSDIYYYRTFDTDNNVEIHLDWGFNTDNTIISQSEMDDDSVIVCSVQDLDWDSEIALHAYGDQWKGSVGSFANRNGMEMWNGTALIYTAEGYTDTYDHCINVAHKTTILAPDETDHFSFVTAFKCGMQFEAEDGQGEDQAASKFNISGDALGLKSERFNNLKLYPNPTSIKQVTIDMEGIFEYHIEDVDGRLVQNGFGNGITLLDLTNAANGVYIVKIRQNDEVAVRKLILR